MKRTDFSHRRRLSLTTVLWVNAVLLAGILGVLISRSGTSLMPSALGQQLNNIGGGGGVYVIPAQFSSQQWGCYLVDIDQQTLVAYQFRGGDNQLRLVAARSFKYDRRLGNFSTSPSPREIQTLVEREATAQRKLESPATVPDAAPPIQTPVGPDVGTDHNQPHGTLPPEPH